MQQDCLGNLVADRVTGVECGHRFLEDHADVPATDRPHIVTCLAIGQEIDGILPSCTQDDLTLRDHSRRGDKLHDREGGNALSASTLTDHTECLSTRHTKGNPIDGTHGAEAGVELHMQVSNVNHVIDGGSGRAEPRCRTRNGHHDRILVGWKA